MNKDLGTFLLNLLHSPFHLSSVSKYLGVILLGILGQLRNSNSVTQGEDRVPGWRTLERCFQGIDLVEKRCLHRGLSA